MPTADNDKEITLSYEQLCGLAAQAAGAASVPFMRDHPSYVMPTEEIMDGVRGVLSEFGVDMNRVHGYEQAVT